MPRTHPAGVARRALLLAAIGSIAGCGAYTLRPPYDRTIRTVYVPIFRSFSFREDLNLRLTEEVVKEVERRTPYQVVGSAEEADTILSGTILYANKYERLVSTYNLPRELVSELTAEVTWEDIRPGTDPDVAPPTVRVTEPVLFYPELGETTSLAYDKAISKMAKDIVNMMEARW